MQFIYALMLILMDFGISFNQNIDILGDKIPDKLTDEQVCLVQNLYYEARGETLHGKMYVLSVIENRIKDSRWPDSACGVTWQRAQFSWTLEDWAESIRGVAPHPTSVRDKEALKEITALTRSLTMGLWRPDTTANHYFNPEAILRDPDGHPVTPSWARCKRLPERDCVSYLGSKFASPDYVVDHHWFYTL